MLDTDYLTTPFIGHGGNLINPPHMKMTVEERAEQMWQVHPFDLDRMKFATRQEFYEAHLKAAISQT